MASISGLLHFRSFVIQQEKCRVLKHSRNAADESVSKFNKPGSGEKYPVI